MLESWDVPSISDTVGYTWYHVPAGGSLFIVVLSHKPCWYVGHYVGGRMLRCAGCDCAWCQRGIGRQVRCVLCVAESSTHRVGVIELSESVGLLVRDWGYARGTMRGLQIELHRVGRSKHSRIEAQFLSDHEPEWSRSLQSLDMREVLDDNLQRSQAALGAMAINDNRLV
jgi:hypothetical protein